MSTNGFGNGFTNGLGPDGFGSGFWRPSNVINYVTTGLKLYLDAGNINSYPGSGTTWIDLSGNGKNATLYNSPTYSADNGGIITFSKTSYQYAEGPYLGSLANWTAEAWIKFNATPVAGTNAIITDIYDLTSKLNFSLGTNDPLTTSIKAGFFNGQWRNTTTGTAVSTGTWYHFVGTYDGTTVRLYANNSSVGTLNYVGSADGGGLGYRVARRWDSASNDAGNFISGAIPLLRVYNRALTTDEITTNYNSEKARYGL